MKIMSFYFLLSSYQLHATVFRTFRCLTGAAYPLHELKLVLLTCILFVDRSPSLLVCWSKKNVTNFWIVQICEAPLPWELPPFLCKTTNERVCYMPILLCFAKPMVLLMGFFLQKHWEIGWLWFIDIFFFGSLCPLFCFIFCNEDLLWSQLFIIIFYLS